MFDITEHIWQKLIKMYKVPFGWNSNREFQEYAPRIEEYTPRIQEYTLRIQEYTLRIQEYALRIVLILKSLQMVNIIILLHIHKYTYK